MARATWSGSISFGLVNVPVEAYSATHDHTVHFHQLEKGTGARVRYRKVSDKSGDEIEADDIELGYELSKGRYVTLDRDELDELRPDSTRTIDIGDFVALSEIDPVYYDHTYWLVPEETGANAYRLLLAAMEDRQLVGIGTVVMRNKQYLAAIRPLDGALAMSTMRFADEVVARSEVDGLTASRTKPSAKELKLATQVVDSLTTDWKPSRYHDTYTDELHDLLDQKAKGKDVVSEPSDESEDSGAKVLDLMAALQASVDAARKPSRSKGGSSKAGSSKAGSRKAPATKLSAKKSGVKKAAAKKSSAKKAPAKRSAKTAKSA
jgi:DNA end-binding protein Ku